MHSRPYFVDWALEHLLYCIVLLLRRMTLWPWPLTFWSWECIMYSASHVTFTALRRRLSHVIGGNWVFPLWRLQSSLRMRSITWPVHRRSPKPHVTIFWPRIAYSLYNFYGATMTIKGSSYWSIPMLKRFSFAKKLSSVKICPKMAVFRKFKGLNKTYMYSHRDPKKALPYPERRHLTYFAYISV